MNENDIQVIRRVAREEVYEILDTEVWDALFELVNAFEAGIMAFKQCIGNKKGLAQKPLWIPDKIKWEPAEGQSGSYERSEDVSNPDFKAMLKDLAMHGGKLTRNGWFYWTFKNGSTVGRKKRG